MATVNISIYSNPLCWQAVFRNRIFNSPTGVSEFPIQDCIHYYERKALGGARVGLHRRCLVRRWTV